MVEPKIIIVLLFYNNIKWLDEAVHGILSDPYFPKELIFLDNGSEAEISNEVRKRYPNIPTYKVPVNKGFDHGISQGLQFSLKFDSTHVLIHTADIVLGPNAVTELANSIKEKSGQNIGVWGLYPIEYNDKKTLAFAPAAKITNWFTFYRKRVFLEDIRAGHSFDYTTGIMMFSRKLIETIGGFDDELFMYFEEMDYCLRAKKAGFRITVANKAIYYYRSAMDEKTYKKANLYFVQRNAYFVHRKHAPIWSKPFFLVWYLSKLSTFTVGAFFKYRARPQESTAPLYFYAARDIIKSQRGIGSLNQIRRELEL